MLSPTIRATIPAIIPVTFRQYGAIGIGIGIGIGIETGIGTAIASRAENANRVLRYRSRALAVLV